MTCVQCGNLVGDGWKFCPVCGAAQPKQTNPPPLPQDTAQPTASTTMPANAWDPPTPAQQAGNQQSVPPPVPLPAQPQQPPMYPQQGALSQTQQQQSTWNQAPQQPSTWEQAPQQQTGNAQFVAPSQPQLPTEGKAGVDKKIRDYIAWNRLRQRNPNLFIILFLCCIGSSFVIGMAAAAIGNDAIMGLAGLTMLGIGIASLIVFLRNIYFSWVLVNCLKTVASGYDQMITPGTAVGFLFIPFFNIYWATRAFGSLAEHYETLAYPNGVYVNISKGWGVAIMVMLLTSFIPLLGIIASLALLVTYMIFDHRQVTIYNNLLRAFGA